MTTVHTVAAIEESTGRVLFLGHFTKDSSCPVCAALHELDIRLTRCQSPREHSLILAEQYHAMTDVEVRTMSRNYRQPVNRKLWQKVAFATRQELGVTA